MGRQAHNIFIDLRPHYAEWPLLLIDSANWFRNSMLAALRKFVSFCVLRPTFFGKKKTGSPDGSGSARHLAGQIATKRLLRPPSGRWFYYAVPSNGHRWQFTKKGLTGCRASHMQQSVQPLNEICCRIALWVLRRAQIVVHARKFLGNKINQQKLWK